MSKGTRGSAFARMLWLAVFGLAVSCHAILLSRALGDMSTWIPEGPDPWVSLAGLGLIVWVAVLCAPRWRAEGVFPLEGRVWRNIALVGGSFAGVVAAFALLAPRSVNNGCDGGLCGLPFFLAPIAFGCMFVQGVILVAAGAAAAVVWFRLLGRGTVALAVSLPLGVVGLHALDRARDPQLAAWRELASSQTQTQTQTQTQAFIWGQNYEPAALPSLEDRSWRTDETFGRPGLQFSADLPTAGALSADGRILAVAASASAGIWDVDRAYLERVVPLESATRFIAVSPDGRSIAYGTGRDLRLRPLQPDDAPSVKVASDPADEFASATFSPDGRWLIAATVHGGVHAIELARNAERWSLPSGNTSGRTALAISPDSTWIFVRQPGSERLLALALDSGKRISEQAVAVNQAPYEAAITSDGTTVRGLAPGGGVLEWVPLEAAPPRFHASPTRCPRRLFPTPATHLAPDGSFVLTRCSDHLEQWTVEGLPLRTSRPAPSFVPPLGIDLIAPGGHWAILEGEIWDLDPRVFAPKHPLGHHGPVTGIVAGAGGVAAVGLDETLLFWPNGNDFGMRTHAQVGFERPIAVDDHHLRGSTPDGLYDLDTQSAALTRTPFPSGLLNAHAELGPHGRPVVISARTQAGVPIAIVDPPEGKRLKLPFEGAALPAGGDRLILHDRLQLRVIDFKTRRLLWQRRFASDRDPAAARSEIENVSVQPELGEVWVEITSKPIVRLALATGKKVGELPFFELASGGGVKVAAAPGGKEFAGIDGKGVVEVVGPNGEQRDALHPEAVHDRATTVAYGADADTLYVGTARGLVYRLKRK